MRQRTIPVTWAVGGVLPNAIIVGEDGFYVRWQESYRSLELCAGHVDVVGGLFQEWADGGCDLADVEGRPAMIRAHARRMIRRARTEYPNGVMTTLDLTARYQVDGFAGIAFRLLGWALAAEDPEPFLACDLPADILDDHEHDESCWVLPEETEVTESDTWVRVVMIGDDTVHDVEYTDLHLLDLDDYCHECGQIGCTHDGRDLRA